MRYKTKVYSRVKIFITGILIITCVGLVSGQVNITEYGQIGAMMERYRSINKSQPNVEGWRIQIITTDDRRRMERALNKFRAMYPDISSSWTHRSPYYQVKVGAFRDKLDYQKFLLEVKENFPSAIPIIERIKKEELIKA